MHTTLIRLFPGFKEGDWLVQDDGGGAYIKAWNRQEPQPSSASIAEAEVYVARAAKLAQVNAACDAAIHLIRETYPETEVLSWPKQEAEARALLADETAATPLLDAIAAGRGLTRAELAERVIAKADSFALVSGAAIGKRQALEDRINDAETPEQLSVISW